MLYQVSSVSFSSCANVKCQKHFSPMREAYDRIHLSTNFIISVANLQRESHRRFAILQTKLPLCTVVASAKNCCKRAGVRRDEDPAAVPARAIARRRSSTTRGVTAVAEDRAMIFPIFFRRVLVRFLAGTRTSFHIAGTSFGWEVPPGQQRSHIDRYP